MLRTIHDRFEGVTADTLDGSAYMRDAVYTDQGEEQAPPLTAESIRVLRSPTLNAAQADDS